MGMRLLKLKERMETKYNFVVSRNDRNYSRELNYEIYLEFS